MSNVCASTLQPSVRRRHGLKLSISKKIKCDGAIPAVSMELLYVRFREPGLSSLPVPSLRLRRRSLRSDGHATQANKDPRLQARRS